jgi:hypothetical protein
METAWCRMYISHGPQSPDKLECVGIFVGNRVVPTVWFLGQAAGCGQTDNIQVPYLQADGVSHEDASSAVPCSHTSISKNASVHRC